MDDCRVKRSSLAAPGSGSARSSISHHHQPPSTIRSPFRRWTLARPVGRRRLRKGAPGLFRVIAVEEALSGVVDSPNKGKRPRLERKRRSSLCATSKAGRLVFSEREQNRPAISLGLNPSAVADLTALGDCRKGGWTRLCRRTRIVARSVVCGTRPGASPVAGTAVPRPATWTIRRPVRPSKIGSPEGVIVRRPIVVTTVKR